MNLRVAASGIAALLPIGSFALSWFVTEAALSDTDCHLERTLTRGECRLHPLCSVPVWSGYQQMRLLQSANERKSQPTNEPPEERQQQKDGQ